MKVHLKDTEGKEVIIIWAPREDAAALRQARARPRYRIVPISPKTVIGIDLYCAPAHHSVRPGAHSPAVQLWFTSFDVVTRKQSGFKGNQCYHKFGPLGTLFPQCPALQYWLIEEPRLEYVLIWPKRAGYKIIFFTYSGHHWVHVWEY